MSRPACLLARLVTDSTPVVTPQPNRQVNKGSRSSATAIAPLAGTTACWAKDDTKARWYTVWPAQLIRVVPSRSSPVSNPAAALAPSSRTIRAVAASPSTSLLVLSTNRAPGGQTPRRCPGPVRGPRPSQGPPCRAGVAHRTHSSPLCVSPPSPPPLMIGLALSRTPPSPGGHGSTIPTAASIARLSASPSWPAAVSTRRSSSVSTITPSVLAVTRSKRERINKV